MNCLTSIGSKPTVAVLTENNLSTMDRKSFSMKLAMLGVCPFIAGKLTAEIPVMDQYQQDDKLQALESQKKFIQNWLSDLLESMDKNLDRATQEKIVAGCGVACLNRHQFKKDIAIAGTGNLDKLIEAYKKNFEIWKDGNTVHVRYGEVSKQCYCPAANYRESRPDDIHCECTRNTHKAIFDTALGSNFRVDVAESLRRGGKTCHFIVHLT
jgi:hypothetical protein